MAQPKFIPRPGQVDYTNIRYAPVVNTIVVHSGKVLLVQRSSEMRLYLGFGTVYLDSWTMPKVLKKKFMKSCARS